MQLKSSNHCIHFLHSLNLNQWDPADKIAENESLSHISGILLKIVKFSLTWSVKLNWHNSFFQSTSVNTTEVRTYPIFSYFISEISLIQIQREHLR